MAKLDVFGCGIVVCVVTQNPRRLATEGPATEAGGINERVCRLGPARRRPNLDPASRRERKVEIVINPKSIDTGDAVFDRQIAAR